MNNYEVFLKELTQYLIFYCNIKTMITIDGPMMMIFLGFTLEKYKCSKKDNIFIIIKNSVSYQYQYSLHLTLNRHFLICSVIETPNFPIINTNEILELHSNYYRGISL